jgi:hypothetical protein
MEPDSYFGQQMYTQGGLYSKLNSIIKGVVDRVRKDRCVTQADAGTSSTIGTDTGTSIGTSIGGTSTGSGTLPPVSSLVLSKLPIVLRPGNGCLYHFPDQL